MNGAHPRDQRLGWAADSANSHGPRLWLRSGSISRAKLRTFMQMMCLAEEMGNGVTASQRGRHPQSRKAEQIDARRGTQIEFGAESMTLMQLKQQMFRITDVVAPPADENIGGESPNTVFYSPMSYGYGAHSSSMEDRDRSSGNSRYCLVASKQMVGIFLTVWVRSEIRDDVKNMKVSCVGRGLMGYLGNKGSISISMSLHQTTFCFICSHLTSGQKEGDELRRNSDVMEILRKTRFPQVHMQGDEKSPETILEHDRIIWLGDLNYRIALSYRYAKALVEMRDWRALLEKDQLSIEQRCGTSVLRVGMKEGYTSLPHINTLITQIDMPGMTCIQKRSGEHLPETSRSLSLLPLLMAYVDVIALAVGGGLHFVVYKYKLL
ncbi:hypothetical protein J5N97_010756 [Dioscorea zingiberensis]|uniref:Inositol polyphosphate-related phosphatase domain-containing protein n=1 Tax=Dioscorea zingiberensis TaxID=325984 RepID=A0A9D5HN34_9LILI|nr:hypothetical protein J5N97_010756 [Dioscorea zingiberensis]